MRRTAVSQSLYSCPPAWGCVGDRIMELAELPERPAAAAPSEPPLAAATRPSFATQAGALTRKNLRYQQKNWCVKSPGRR